MKQVINKNKYVLISIFSILCFLILWELLLNIIDVSKIVLIKPTAIFKRLFSDFDIIGTELLYTITEIIPGWVVGNFLGFLLAVLIYRNKNLSSSLTKFSVLINAIPLIALTAILGGIIGTDRSLKIIIVSLIVFFPMFITTLSGLESIDENQKNLFNSYSATEKEFLFKLLLPKAFPSILNTIKVSVITAISTAITAEFFGGYGGIGIFILSKKGLYNLESVWASIFVIVIFGSIFYFTVGYIQKKLITWQES